MKENIDLNKKNISVAFTGYRPDKLPGGGNYLNEATSYLINLIYDAIDCAYINGYSVFYTGLAMGYDILCAEMALRYKKLTGNNITLIGVRPFPKQNSKWEKSWVERYDYVLNNCDEVVTISASYNISAYHIRNKYMVDRARCVITYFDGQPGGTASTLAYARQNGVEIINLNNILGGHSNADSIEFNGKKN